MVYNIQKSQYKIADILGINIVSSIYPTKKIDVLDFNNNYICSIGSYGGDYFFYLKNYGKEYAMERRRLYLLRHKKNINNLGSRQYYSARILWNY
jgi:hypothetical protein